MSKLGLWALARSMTFCVPQKRLPVRQFSILTKNSPTLRPNFRNLTSSTLSEQTDAKEEVAEKALVTKESDQITLDDFLEDERFNKSLRKAVQSLGFERFTPVQERGILPFMSENGVVCKAKTGTGKTLSFVIPLMNKCLEQLKAEKRRSSVRGLIIAPTRDLARQIYEDIMKLCNYSPDLKRKVSVALWCGGTQRQNNNRSAKPNIVVGTPGRILDNLGSKGRDFADLEYRVFDEADRLLDQGFEDTLYDIDDALQQLRNPTISPLKNTLFSATVDDTVIKFARAQIGEEFKYINCVSHKEAESHKAIHQELVKTESFQDSFCGAISHILEKLPTPNYKAILFLPTKVFCESTYDMLRNLTRSRNIYRLHGDLSQARRDRTTADFKKAKSGILICTDVAARGMDFKNITEVVQVGGSRDLSDYVHKIGRTGRAGALGSAKLYLSSPEMPFANLLKRKMGIEFSETTELGPQEVEPIFERVSVHPDDVENQIGSLMGAQKSIADTYRLDKHEIVKDVVDLYRLMIGDPSAKYFMSSKKFTTIGMPATLVPDHIEVDNMSAINQKRLGPRDMRGQFRRNNQRGGFDSFNSSRMRRGDRFSSYRSDSGGSNYRKSLSGYLKDLDSYEGNRDRGRFNRG